MWSGKCDMKSCIKNNYLSFYILHKNSISQTYQRYYTLADPEQHPENLKIIHILHPCCHPK